LRLKNNILDKVYYHSQNNICFWQQSLNNFFNLNNSNISFETSSDISRNLMSNKFVLKFTLFNNDYLSSSEKKQNGLKK